MGASNLLTLKDKKNQSADPGKAGGYVMDQRKARKDIKIKQETQDMATMSSSNNVTTIQTAKDGGFLSFFPLFAQLENKPLGF